MMIDFAPVTRPVAALLEGVRDDQLTARTPCAKYSLADLIDHIGGTTRSFTIAAAKGFAPGTSQRSGGDGSRLGVEWRRNTANALAALEKAWQQPSAWEGVTEVGGVVLPGPVAANVVLGELLIHGWDIARASGQPYDPDADAVAAYTGFAQQMFDPSQDLRTGVFGPVVEVPADALALDRLLGFSGRSPVWPAA